MKKLSFFIVNFLMLAIAFSSFFIKPSFADENAEIETFIENFSADFEKISKLNTQIEKEEASYNLANKILDLKWISNFILGKYRNDFDEKTKEDFTTYYSKSLIKNYISFIDSYKKENYKILSIDKKKENTFLVSTLIKIKDKDVNNSFRIIKRGGRYYITDVITEGVSFISAQRSEVGSIISSGKFDEFLSKLKEENK